MQHHKLPEKTIVVRAALWFSVGIAGCASAEPYEAVPALRHDYAPSHQAKRADDVNDVARKYARQVRAAQANRRRSTAQPPQVRFIDSNRSSPSAARRFASRLPEAALTPNSTATPAPTLAPTLAPRLSQTLSPRPTAASSPRLPAALAPRPVAGKSPRLAAAWIPRPTATSSPTLPATLPARPAATPPATVTAVRPPAHAPIFAAPAAAPAPPAPPPPSPTPLTRQELIDKVLQDVRQGPDPAVVRALTVAALSTADQDRHLDPTDLAELGPTERDAVTQYHALLVRLRAELVEGGEFDPQRIAAQIEQAIEKPVRIRCLHLCWRVDGFGDYELIPDNSFPAGRKNPMVLYLELDRFRIHAQDSGTNEVRLSQEVVLYTDPGGSAVWKQPRVQIVDVSRNRRRDFFVTQPISLPEALSVGKYLLKVTVTDEHSRTMDEIQIPLDLVVQG